MAVVRDKENLVLSPATSIILSRHFGKTPAKII